VNEPLAITREVEQAQVTETSVTQESVTQDTAPAEAIKDAKAS
jgi:sec-independent protein translocase protein TatB